MNNHLHGKIVAVKKQFQRIASLKPLAARPQNHVLFPLRVTANEPCPNEQCSNKQCPSEQCPSPLREKLLNCSPDVPRFDFDGQSFWVRLHSIHDGDTVCVVLELDSKLYRMTTRLIGLDTPEIRTKDLNEKKLAVAARNRVANWALPQHFQVDGVYTEKEIKQVLAQNPVLLWMKCRETEKYGRLLVELFSEANEKNCLNSILLTEGFGDKYLGGKKKRTWDLPTHVPI